ncbi:RNA methyltransferase, partial [Leptospira interrogans]
MLDKNTNLTHQSKIEFVNSNLRGIGFVNNTKIEVPYSLPGDVYNVTFFKKKRRKPSAKLELVS